MEKNRWRKIYDLDKNWIGMEFSAIMSVKEAEKLGYPKKPKLTNHPKKI